MRIEIAFNEVSTLKITPETERESQMLALFQSDAVERGVKVSVEVPTTSTTSKMMSLIVTATGLNKPVTPSSQR